MHALMRLLPIGLLALLLGALCAPAHAQETATAGIIKRVSGTVFIERDTSRLPAAPGMAVMRSDRIVTGTPGAVGITLVDDTLLSAGPGTRLELSEVRFDSTTHEGQLWLRLYKGAIHVITGIIARESPQNVRIETPTAVMGVRGTEFIVDVREE